MDKFLKVFLCKEEYELPVKLDNLDLHETEINRFSEIKSMKKAREFLLSRFILQDILKTEFDLSLKKFKKKSNIPILEDSSINISMSHSGDYFLYGFSNMKIGVDIETKLPKSNAIDLARKYFSLKEQLQIESQPDALEQKKYFQRIWSLKESYFKFWGEQQSIEKVNDLVFDLDGGLDSVSRDSVFYFQKFENLSFSICIESVPVSSKIMILGENVPINSLDNF